MATGARRLIHLLLDMVRVLSSFDLTHSLGNSLTCVSNVVEIVGKVVGTGPDVKSVKVGQRVGMGAQCWSCGQCKLCKNHNETYCKQQKGM